MGWWFVVDDEGRGGDGARPFLLSLVTKGFDDVVETEVMLLGRWRSIDFDFLENKYLCILSNNI